VTADRLTLVTGATGYIGSRLVPALLTSGRRVRCLARDPGRLEAAHWRQQVEVVQGDVHETAAEALAGVQDAFYLVHSIASGADWARRDRAAAALFGRQAAEAGCRRIVYLGGLGTDKPAARLSPHLASRQEVGVALAQAGVPVTEARAAVVIGSGSASFEMLRHLVEVLPVMVCPRWVTTRCQPIAVEDVLDLLVASLADDSTGHHVVEIGGPDVVTYEQMMQLYAEEAGIGRRRIVRVPVLTPHLSSHWVGFVTPVPASLARPLVQSLVNDVVVSRDSPAASLGRPLRSCQAAIHQALVETSGPAATGANDPAWAGAVEYEHLVTLDVPAPATAVFEAVCAVGGDNGWGADWLWTIRGGLDRLAGGEGMRRGLRDLPLRPGSRLDWWQVSSLVPGESLVLRADMALPGLATLSWYVEAGEAGATILRQRAGFVPRGLAGRAYWRAVAPFHRLVFPALGRSIARRATQAGSASPRRPRLLRSRRRRRQARLSSERPRG
jgi:uncharacterized protein YbjT (DUF2867 family)